jgi:hypothetical protein
VFRSCSNCSAHHLQNNRLLQLLCVTPPEQQAAPITVHNTSRTTSCSNYFAHLQNKLLQLQCTTPPEQQAAPITLLISRTTSCSNYFAHLQNKLFQLQCTTPPEQQAVPITVHNASRTTSCSNYCTQHLQHNKLLQLLCTTWSVLYIYIKHIEEFRAVLPHADNGNVKQLFCTIVYSLMGL